MKLKHKSWLASVVIILLLVLAGPAQAFILSLTVNSTSPQQGDVITFTAQIQIEPGERLPVDYLTLKISGPDTEVCEFYPNGEIKKNCKGLISITRSSESTYGYGYGYGYGYYDHGYGYSSQEYNFGYGYGYGYSSLGGKLVYKIKLSTSSYPLGKYNTQLSAKINENTFSQPGPELTVISQGSRGGGSDDECETTWTCTDWGPCNGRFQYRSCELQDEECTIHPPKPGTARTCQIEPLSFDNTGNFQGPSSENQDETSQNLNDGEESGISHITGAVIGPGGTTLGDLFILIMGMVIVIGGLTTLILLRRAHLRNKLAFYTNEFT